MTEDRNRCRGPLTDLFATALEESNKTGIENAMREVRKNINDLQYEWDEAVLDRAQLAVRHAASLKKISEAHQTLLEVNIQHVEAESDIEGLKLRNASIMQSLEEEREKVQVAKRESDEAKRQGQELGQMVSQMLAESDEQRTLLTALQEGKTAEEVQMEADAEEAKLELIQAANPNVMRDFERRATEIARLRKKMEGSTEKLSRLTEQTETIMGKWEPKLDELVSLINDAFAYNFEQISCAGEVRVHKDDDFEQWALDIMVKFRYVASSLLYCTMTAMLITPPLQRERRTPTTQRPPPVRRRARRVHHLLPHGPPIPRPVPLPRRRRDQPGHGPPQRAHGARAHGRDCLPRAHVAVLPHHAQAAHGPALRRQDEDPLHRQRRAHAPGGTETRFQAVPQRAKGANGCCVIWAADRYVGDTLELPTF